MSIRKGITPPQFAPDRGTIGRQDTSQIGMIPDIDDGISGLDFAFVTLVRDFTKGKVHTVVSSFLLLREGQFLPTSILKESAK
jgi:hypothetical protein